jgi:hypothetical protein
LSLRRHPCRGWCSRARRPTSRAPGWSASSGRRSTVRSGTSVTSSPPRDASVRRRAPARAAVV